VTGEDVDVGIRMARHPGTGLAPQRLLTEMLVPVCSPAYLQSHADSRGNIDLRAPRCCTFPPSQQIGLSGWKRRAWLNPNRLRRCTSTKSS
jgi:DNA-binding transcriptional LysR family regulator